jgi:3-methyladenine DNA glycosylase AlkD
VAADRALIDEIREALAGEADPGKAAPMQAYMKSAMPCRGVHSPEQKRIFRRVFSRHPIASRAAWNETVAALWDEAAYREERYAAIALTGAAAYRAYQTAEAIPLYERLIVSGAWWDYVDELAIRRIGPILRAQPALIRPLMLAWSRDEDLWKRRSAIICQVGAKAETDRDLLKACLEPNLSDRDFFIRKAIGWALREYAKTQPAWVHAWVVERDLSGLSRREALKNL